MENCLIKKINGSIDGFIQFAEFRFIAKKFYIRFVKDTQINIVTPNVTFVGGGRSVTVGTTGATVELTSQAIVSILDKYSLQVLTLVEDNEVNINDLSSLNLIELAFASQSSGNIIYGNIDNLISCVKLKRINNDNTSNKILEGDISKLLSNLNFTGQLDYYLETTNFDQNIYGDISALNHISQVRNFRISNAPISGSIKEIGSEFYSPTASRPLLYFRNCPNVYGSVEDFVATQRTYGHTTGNMEVYFRRTQCTYNGNPFTDNKKYILTWDASNINLVES